MDAEDSSEMLRLRNSQHPPIIDTSTGAAGSRGLTGVRAVCGMGAVSAGRAALSLQSHQKIPRGNTDSDSRE